MLELYRSGVPIEHALMVLARSWAQARSKSPRTKVGAVLYCPDSGMMFFGYNGLPRGMPDTQELWDNDDPADPMCVYNYVQHAEMNSVRKAWQCGAVVNFSTAILCVTTYPCHHCMKDFVVPTGIKTVWFDQYHRLHDPSAIQPTEILAQQNHVQLQRLEAA